MDRAALPWIVVVAACSGPAASRSAIGPKTGAAAAEPPACNDPRDYELGRGVERDYAQAATAWSCRCDRGDPDACARLGFAAGTGLGADYDVERGLVLLEQACRDGSALGCALLAQADRKPDPAVATAALERAARSCDRGDLDACAAEASLGVWMQLGTVADAGEAARRSCESGRLLGCWTVSKIVEVRRTIAFDGCTRDHLSPDACMARLQSERAGDPELALAARIDQIKVAACRAGDLDGCEMDTQLARVRCQAHDWFACTETGDDASLRAACEHRLPSGCRDLAVAARDADAPDRDVARTWFERACAAGDRQACVDVRDPDLGGGCAALQQLDAVTVPAVLRGVDRAGKPAEVRITGPTLVLVWAPWVVSPPLKEIDAFAASAGLPLVVVASTDTPAEIGAAHVANVLIDPVAAGATFGPQTLALGIDKVPELLVVDGGGRTRARVVALSLTVNHRRCIDQVR